MEPTPQPTPTKPFYTSKIFWLNLVGAVVGVGQYFVANPLTGHPELQSAFTTAVAVGTILLRIYGSAEKLTLR